jgi:glycopeptide antibiotics resistance protein
MFMWLLGSIGLAVIAITPVVLLGGFVIVWRSRTRTWRQATVPVLRALALPIVVIAILVVALRPGDIAPGDAYAINLEPFRDLRRSLEGGHLVDIALQNLAGNAAMFVPFGAIVAWVFPGSRVLAVLIVAVAFSAAIEIAQATLNVGRSSDITDVIMNTAGAVLGFGVWRAALRLSSDSRPRQGRRS